MDGLTKADIQKVREAMVLNRELEQQIERAKACNFDCEGHDERCQLMKIQCQKILDTYGNFFPQVH